ncbi:putative translation initiation factor IF-2, translation initiation factor IF-2 [Helianthus debilis subsp. tardiflorus]
MRLAREAEPVKVELMEVDEDGMLIDELAYNLAVSEGEILGHLYAKGIKPDGVQKLDKEMVKMICREYDVKVINVGPAKIEEMAKKKEILYEDDLDNLQDRPPVLTIMGHLITEKHQKAKKQQGLNAPHLRCSCNLTGMKNLFFQRRGWGMSTKRMIGNL